ncbi:MAG: hypothetical protein FGM52_09975, partial [Mycobacterium sp.]|nr:hypothetical protein [Mycobacterium sp.]
MEPYPSDAVVVARMHAAAQVLRDAGLRVDAGQDAAAHLRNAVHWHRYSCRPVPALHRSCGRDVARGSLRLWAAAGGVPEGLVIPPTPPPPPSLRGHIQLARVQLSGQARAMCAALRDGLSAQAAGLSRRTVRTFDEQVHRQARQVTADLDAAVGGRLADLGLPVDPCGWSDFAVQARLPARHRPGLENRLSTLVGAGFGAGMSLSLGRIVAGLAPQWTPIAAVVCGLLGLALTAWTVSA